MFFLYEKFTDYHVWGWIVDKFNCLNPQPKNIPELKTALLMIWDKLPREAIRKSINQSVNLFVQQTVQLDTIKQQYKCRVETRMTRLITLTVTQCANNIVM